MSCPLRCGQTVSMPTAPRQTLRIQLVSGWSVASARPRKAAYSASLTHSVICFSRFRVGFGFVEAPVRARPIG